MNLPDSNKLEDEILLLVDLSLMLVPNMPSTILTLPEVDLVTPNTYGDNGKEFHIGD